MSTEYGNASPNTAPGVQRVNRILERSCAQTPAGIERAFNRAMREIGLGEPTRAQLEARRAQQRNAQGRLPSQEINPDAWRDPGVGRERCPRLTRGRRRPGWRAVNFVLPLQVILGLGLLTKALAARQHAERKDQPHGFQRRYPKTKNHWVVAGINHVLREHGLEQFCAELPEEKSTMVDMF